MLSSFKERFNHSFLFNSYFYNVMSCSILRKAKKSGCVLIVHRVQTVFIGQIYLLGMTGTLFFLT